MAPRDQLLDQIRRLALQGMGERRTDGQLLEHFISERDEAAFALLLRRHGAMVWSVCRRVLGNAHDADDAFQAAFLVLVRKADSVRPREAVGNWLYGVAYRTAMEARGRIARRRAKELPLQDVPSQSKAEEPGQELRSILDRELSRLADKYRLPIVLCDLEGRSRKEVAQQLAIPEGTLSSRLATARKKLAARLARLGFVVSGASLMALLTESTATAGMGPSLFTSTTKAALLIAAGPATVAGVVSATVSTLTEGVLKTMFIAKVKTTVLVLCSVAALGVGTGGVYYQTRAVGAADPPREDRIAQDNRKTISDLTVQELNKQLRVLDELTLKKSLVDIEGLEDELKRQHALQLHKLEAEFKAKLAKLRQQKADLLKRSPVPQQNRKTPAPPVARANKLAPRNSNPALENLQLTRNELELSRRRLEAQYESEVTALQVQRAVLDEQHKMKMLQLQEKIKELDHMQAKIEQEQTANQLKPKEGPIQGDSDKLDQILKRLQHLENRLDHLEKRKGEINFTSPKR